MDSQVAQAEVSETGSMIGQEMAKAVEGQTEPTNEMLMTSLVSSLNKSGEHQWDAGDLVQTLRRRWFKKEDGHERPMTLKDIFLSINRRYSVPYLSVLSSVCKMFNGAIREEALASGATFSDCRDAYRLRQAVSALRESPALSVLKEYLSAKEICLTPQETKITGFAATGDKRGSPVNLAIALRKMQANGSETSKVAPPKTEYDRAVADEFAPQTYENATSSQKKFNLRWKNLRSQLANRPRHIEGDGLLIAIELDPKGIPRIAGFEGIASDAHRRLIYGALAHLCRKHVSKAADVGKIVKEIMSASKKTQITHDLKPSSADAQEKRMRRNQVPSKFSEAIYEEDRK